MAWIRMQFSGAQVCPAPQSWVQRWPYWEGTQLPTQHPLSTRLWHPPDQEQDPHEIIKPLSVEIAEEEDPCLVLGQRGDFWEKKGGGHIRTVTHELWTVGPQVWAYRVSLFLCLFFFFF